jgi:serine/threonine-protein kinase
MGQAEDGSPYLVMELLEGEGFDARLARVGTIPPVDVAAWVAFVARGLEEAHVRGLIHRDLKPGNIFFAFDDRGDVVPKILDFGVSKAIGIRQDGDFVKTTTGAVLGSPAYMSPEQAQGETNVDGRSDVWALGVMLYEAITGQIPFDAPNYNALMVTIMTKPHRPVLELAPSCPPELATIIDYALEKDKTIRCATARELADRLESFLKKISAMIYPAFKPKMSVISSPPPAGANSTTQGPWSEEPRTLARRQLQQQQQQRRSHAGAWAGFLLATSLAAGFTVAFVHSRPPMASVAGREAVALTTRLARLKDTLDRLRPEPPVVHASALPASPATASADSDDLSIEPAELPPAKPAAATAPRPAPGGGASRPRRGPSRDPHGGVDSAGF